MMRYLQPESFRNALRDFQKSAANLSKAFEHDLIDQQHAAKDYPFQESFDAVLLAIQKWIDTQDYQGVFHLWRIEHGPAYNVPKQFDALVDLGVLSDYSYHNDTCPRFTREVGDGIVVNIWVEHENVADREDPSCNRFVVQMEDE